MEKVESLKTGQENHSTLTEWRMHEEETEERNKQELKEAAAKAGKKHFKLTMRQSGEVSGAQASTQLLQDLKPKCLQNTFNIKELTLLFQYFWRGL